MQLSRTLIIILITTLSCTEVITDKQSLPPSTGKYGEVLVVVDTLFENKQTGIELQEIFYKLMPGLPQQEPQFRMSTVSNKSFKSILKRSRNILKLRIGQGKKSSISIEDDIWAKNQLVISITAASDSEAASILKKNANSIRLYFNDKEIKRLQSQYANKLQNELMNDIKEQYKIEFSVPPGFVKMAQKENSFWLKKEKTIGEHQVLQGLSYYSYPYAADSVFSINELIQKRNEFTANHIQGARDSSFMVVYEEEEILTKEVNLNEIYAVEYRGLWNMKNDFMGGPFLHYTLVDEERNRVVHIDGFVYAPKFNKREYLRELEALIKTIELVKPS